MATPIDLLDPPAVMSYGGLVDASTVEGQADDAADWAETFAAIPAVGSDQSQDPSPGRDQPEARHLAHITRRRGAYSPIR